MSLILKNCFTTLKRFKMASLLNILGLSVAFAVFMVIFTQLRYEFTYDTSYTDADNIYRFEVYDTLAQHYGVNCCTPVYDKIAENVTGIEAYGILWHNRSFPITRIDEHGTKHNYSEAFFRITDGFLKVFSMDVIAGDAHVALENGKFIIAESVSQKLFGKENSVGKTVMLGEKEYEIGAVYKDFPKNSSLGNGVYTKLKTEDDWSEWSYLGFFKLNPSSDIEEINKKINSGDFPNSAAGQEGESTMQSINFGGRYQFSLQPIKNNYFSKTVIYDYGSGQVGNKTMSYVLLLIGILILLIAYVNFTNFSTALAPVRIKSINTQKVMGASQGLLRGSLMAESAIISLLSFGLSLLWAYLFTQSALSQIFFANATLDANMDIVIITGVLSILLGLFAGIYPALYMTSFQPALVLKGSFALTPRGVRLRNTLITVQFVTAMILIIGSLFIKLQHNYLRNQPIGMEKENIVVIPIEDDENIKSQLKSVASEMMASPDIYDWTSAAFFPGQVHMGWGRSFDGKEIQVAAWPVAHNFLRFFGIPIVEGSDFFEHNEAGINKYIFNQKTVKNFDLHEPIGKGFTSFVNMGTVVGIAADVNYASLRQEVDPMIFICGDDQRTGFLFLKIAPTNTPATIAHIKKVYAKFSEKTCEFRFLDESMDELYKKESNLANMISLFSLIAIIIALMGIYGLILFNAKFKVREIGIRKVNGASESEIIFMLNKGFLKLIVIAFVIAVPASYYLVYEWMKDFPYHVAIYWWVFAIAGLLTVLITLLTVSYQSWKAAIQNPVNAIKAE